MNTARDDRFITINVLDISRRPSSRNGNPRWRFHTAHGWFDTKHDIGQAYEVSGSEHRLKEKPLRIWLDGNDRIWKWEQVDTVEAQLTDEEARTIAAQWQSPGRVGSHLAAFASGAPVSRADVMWDIQATLELEHGASAEDRHQLRLLAEYFERVMS